MELVLITITEKVVSMGDLRTQEVYKTRSFFFSSFFDLSHMMVRIQPQVN